MITRETVLVLGAGASRPFGFPLALQLYRQVCSELDDEDRWPYRILAKAFHADLIRDFRKALHHSGKYSVDAFLEHRPEFMDIGKASMAVALLPAESKDLFSEDWDKQNWYKYLFSKMDTPDGRFADNALSVVTFNYDRSLEHFLFTALKNSYRMSDSQCATAMSNIPIIHVHGQLGQLPWQDDRTVKLPSTENPPCGSVDLVVPYGAKRDVTAMEKAAACIRVISEMGGSEEGSQLPGARNAIAEAERVVFLGSGYHAANMRRLRLDRSKKNVGRGSCFGMTESEVSAIMEEWPVSLYPANPDWGVLQFLRETGLLD